MPIFRKIFLAAFLGLALAPILHAAPSVTAVLNSDETEIDRPVQLQIKVTGDANAAPPNEIAIDGLEIHYTGESREFQLNGFTATSSLVFTYTILPEKAGTYHIPPLAVRTSGGEMRTEALTLNVSPDENGATTSSRPRGNRGIDTSRLIFAELVVPKTTAYIGETVPAEIRLGFDPHVHPQLSDGPTITGQGFTTQRMPQPKQSFETINGRSYQVLTFKTAIAAARSGKFQIGPVEAKAVVQLPRRPGGNLSPHDLFGMNDPFSDPFFNDPFAGMIEQREVAVKSQSVTLDVKPLPPHAPPSFAGAVGNFTLTSDVKPKTAQIGDPLTITATITGRGNFDRVTAPELENDRGWHTYPPSADFKPDDDVGLSGTKTFEMVLTPNEQKKAVPPLIFSYFDPLKNSYVTLKSDRMPVVVEGGIAPTATPAIAANSPARPPTAATTSPQNEDILYQLTDQPHWGQTFAPVFSQPVFWAAQGVPLLGLIGFFGWKTRQRRLADREAQRVAAWEHESAELQKKLRRADDPPDEYFAGALRVLQLKTALARRIEPNNVDADAVVAAFDLSDEKRSQVRELFRHSDELRYSGRQNPGAPISGATQREVLDLLDHLS
jgi:hypothetical protein